MLTSIASCYTVATWLGGINKQQNKGQTMKAYYIKTSDNPYYQTTPIHEHVVASVGLNDSEEDIAAFIQLAGVELCFTLCQFEDDDIYTGHQVQKIKIPIPHTREGLRDAIKIATRRGYGDPYISASGWGQYRLHFGSKPELLGV